MIKLMADSTCDLSHEVLDLYNISLAPLTVKIEGNVFRDRVEIKPEEFYEMMDKLSEFPTTGAPSPTEYVDILKDAVAEGHTEILCICMSSGTSASYQSAELAKDYFFEENPDSSVRIHIVDSKCMSHGSGWLLIKSALMREQGASFEELVEFNETYKTKVKHFLSVDDLNHLIKSGRISNASAMIGKFLLLKPIMTMKDGKGSVVAKERGRKKVLKHYVNEFKKRIDNDITDFIIIGFTSDRTVAETLKEKVQAETEFAGEIHVLQMGVAVGTHVGLGAISMFFVEKQ
ncbi:DegV family protein [Jeotgalibacillus proteolyticus]|uniref:DegV family protein n=1 Tax=Jeotgalibacillus proteolyticus TaxID=2082395 RepID=A0A2S5G8T8_9BACL|nr:DegV family protein [Jeotgalibacillus proteolyticus]PPA69355.1 DegV family protein [Jeotgalibacillus proteolyticus]